MSANDGQSFDKDATPIAVAGVVEKIVYSNSENGYVIAEIKPHQKGTPPITIKGTLPGLKCGECVSIIGRKVWHPTFGMQVEAESFTVTMPASVEAMRKFLSSGLVNGVGKGFAEKIVARFGDDTSRILNEESAKLREIPGLGEKRAKLIKTAWDEQKALREVMMLLQTYGIGLRRCMKIVRRYGNDAPRLLRDDPYALARDIDGIGFKTADAIALNTGVASDSPKRIEAGIVFAIGEAEADGHTALAPSELTERAMRLLGSNADKTREGLDDALKNGVLTTYHNLIQLPGNARAEQSCAESLKRIVTSPSALPPIKIDSAIDWAEKRAGFSFAPEQTEAVATALRSKLCVITGGPGTGKTSILRAIVDILRAKKARITLASPTGRAAQRLAEATGMQASTLHRLLRIGAGEETTQDESKGTLEADIVIVDEASMLDVKLASALFNNIAKGAHLLLVGDADQLPSVGAGNVLADVISSNVAEVVRLKSVFRQSEDGGIVEEARKILAGDATLPPQISLNALKSGPLGEVSMLSTQSPEQLVEAVVAVCARWRGEGVEPLDMQVLSPMHKGRSGIQTLNAALQKVLNNKGGEGIEDMSGLSYRIGDKVICTRNNYDKSVFNGDMGLVIDVNSGEGIITASFGDHNAFFSRMELVDLLPAYAISIHKSQGSEFDFVVIPVMPEHLILLRRNLLYTAITRAKKHVVIIGSPDAWRMALSSNRAFKRITSLRDRLTS
jgi:exodeoxyribonuclease V alpha subunit